MKLKRKIADLEEVACSTSMSRTAAKIFGWDSQEEALGRVFSITQ